MKPIEFMEDFCEFGEDRVYVLVAIARKRYNPELTHNTEIVYRKVIKDEHDIEWKYQEMKGMMKNKDYNFYLYLTVNARNVVKGFFNYQSRMQDWVKQRMMGDENQNRKFKKVDSHWISELQRPQNRDETYFLFDVDDKEIVDKAIEKIESDKDVLVNRETPNGYHLVSEPFNYNKNEVTELGDVELKTDSLLFLEFVEVEE